MSILDVAADEELVIGARSGDHIAITELFTRHRRLLTSICIGIAGAEGDDAVQNVMLNFPARLETYDPNRGPFVGWISTVAKREALRVARRRDPLSMLPDVPLGDGATDLSTRRDDPEARVVAHSVVLDLLNRLSSRARYAIVATCLLGDSDNDIAEALGVSPVTVRTLRSKARLELSAALPSDAD